ncbi:hypothetical protein BGW80DRAFT_306376 [Lactifluus volemus]|nr:hypothetical protein BGW80DRAFT_306376 [Lactifluus volemus]
MTTLSSVVAARFLGGMVFLSRTSLRGQGRVLWVRSMLCAADRSIFRHVSSFMIPPSGDLCLSSSSPTPLRTVASTKLIKSVNSIELTRKCSQIDSCSDFRRSRFCQTACHPIFIEASSSDLFVNTFFFFLALLNLACRVMRRPPVHLAEKALVRT